MIKKSAASLQPVGVALAVLSGAAPAHAEVFTWKTEAIARQQCEAFVASFNSQHFEGPWTCNRVVGNDGFVCFEPLDNGVVRYPFDYYNCAPLPTPAPTPAPPPMPPLGCASGAGGYSACPGNDPLPVAPPPPQTPANGGPGPELGNQGTPESFEINWEVAPDPGKTCNAAQMVGDPIFPGIGNVYLQEVDYAGPSGGLSFVRSYNSSLPGWWHNLGVRVFASGTQARVLRPDGRSHLFTGSGVGEWSAPGTRERLVRLSPADGSQPTWQYVTAGDGVEWFDAQGRLMSLRARGGATYAVSQSGGLIRSAQDVFGRRMDFTYDASNRLTGLSTAYGTVTYAYDGAGRLAVVRQVDGTTRQYLYESAAFPLALTGLVDERGIRVATWAYDASGRPIGNDRAGTQRHTLQYNADGSATIADPLGAVRTQGFVFAGGKKRYAGQNLPCADCFGDSAGELLDAGTGLVTQSTDFTGGVTLFTHDLQRKLPLSVTRAAGRSEAQGVQIQWHPVLQLPVLVTEVGRSTAMSYDALGNLLSRTVTDVATGKSRMMKWAYDANGLVVSFTDAAGAAWSFEYDNAGNRTVARDALGRSTGFNYDTAGRVVSQTDPSGLATTYGYDARGRVIAVTRAGETTAYGYTPTGKLALVRMPNGYEITFSYDAADRLVAVSDNRGATVQYTLDSMGNRVREEVKDAGGNIAFATSRVVDTLNRVASLQGAVGQSSSFAYDANGRLASVTDPLSQTTRQGRDALGRPTATTFPDNASATQAWDGLDSLTQVTDPKGVKTTYTTNAFGEVVKETSPDIASINFERDAIGDVVSSTDARGNTTEITRDALGRPVRIRDADQTRNIEYDAQGNIARFDDGSGSTAYTRDALGRVLAKKQTVLDNPDVPSQYAVAYGYTNGDLTSVRYPSGLQVFLQRNLGRVTQVSVQLPGKNAKPAVPFASNITYTALGQPKSWNWSNGDTAQRSFDADGRMSANEFASYTYDAASRMTGITQSLVTDTGATQVNWRLGFDSRNRITSMSRDGQSTSFTFDPNSNRLSRMEITAAALDLEGQFDSPGLSLTTSESPKVDPASNRLMGLTVTATATDGSGSSTSTSDVVYAVDAAGNMTSDGLRTFVYDASNRLSKVQAARGGEAVGYEYLHNTLGQRVFKSDALIEQPLGTSKVTKGFIDWLQSTLGWLFKAAGGAGNKSRSGLAFVYDEQGNILAAYGNGSNAAAAEEMEFIWLPLEDGTSVPLGAVKGGQLYAVHADHLGTPRWITDASKSTVWQWPYSAFGANKPSGVLATVTTKTKGATSSAQLKATAPVVSYNLGFPGQYCDAESTLCENGWRSYWPMQGIYPQPDRIGLAGGWNRFGYGGANALTTTDPTGRGLCYYSIRTGQMNCHSDTGGTGFQGQFASGNNSVPGCKDNPDCMSTTGVGPIPTGVWQWDPNGTTSKPGGRVLEPVAVDAQRTAIRTHSCLNPFGPSTKAPFCSEGCVTGTSSTIHGLNKFLDREIAGGQGNTLVVVP